jgi:hypothetical protein
MLLTMAALSRRISVRSSLAIAAALAALPIAGCSGDTNPVRDLVVAAGAGPRATASPDFIASSRPATLDYIPVSTRAGSRPPPRTVDEVKAAEAELDAIRASNEAAGQSALQAGSTPAPSPAEVPVRRPAPARQP